MLTSEQQREMVDRLRSHGVDKYVELPQIAVMGDTSSGKSSVLSCISGIQFPSSDKLCTRCPTQLQLKPAEKFEGTVFIQRYESGRAEGKGEKRKEERSIASLEEVTAVIEEMTGKQLISNCTMSHPRNHM